MPEKRKKIKIRLSGELILLKLNQSQGGIRIADNHGNHVAKPTQTKNDDKYLIEWMITNDEIGELNKKFLKSDIGLIQKMKDIRNFTNQSEYSKRATKSNRKELSTFEGFKIYRYSEDFYSFEKELESGIKVRITFKLGDYGLTAHPHMYVLIPFGYESLKIKNNEGHVSKGSELGSGCKAEVKLKKEDIKEIIITLSHTSSIHRDDLIKIIES